MILSRGQLLILLSAALLALSSALVKELDHLSAYQLAFFRSIFVAPVLLVWIKSRREAVTGNNRFYLFLRGVFGTGGLLAFFYTLQQMPLASAVSIHYLAPIFTAVFSVFFLKETISWKQWSALVIAFAGAALIAGFDARVNWWDVLIGLGGAACAGMAYNLVRILRKTDSVSVIMLSFPVVTGVVTAPFAYLDWTTPKGQDWGFLLALGFASLFIQLLLTYGYRLERAAQAAKLSYFGAIFSLAVGYFLFNELVPWASLVGIGLVLAGAVMGNGAVSQNHEYKKRRHGNGQRDQKL